MEKNGAVNDARPENMYAIYFWNFGPLQIKLYYDKSTTNRVCSCFRDLEMSGWMACEPKSKQLYNIAYLHEKAYSSNFSNKHYCCSPLHDSTVTMNIAIDLGHM